MTPEEWLLRDTAGDGTYIGDAAQWALDEIAHLRGELVAAESTIRILDDPELRAALTEPTTGDYGPVPPPQDVR